MSPAGLFAAGCRHVFIQICCTLQTDFQKVQRVDVGTHDDIGTSLVSTFLQIRWHFVRLHLPVGRPDKTTYNNMLTPHERHILKWSFQTPTDVSSKQKLIYVHSRRVFKAVTIRTKSRPPIDLDLQTSSTPSAAKSHPGLKLCLQTTRTSVDSRARRGCETWQTETTCEPGFRSASPLLVHNGGRDGPLTKRAPVCEDELHPAVFS